MRRGTGHDAQGREWARREDGARRDDRRGAARHGMGTPSRGVLGRVDGVMSRDERSEELGILAIAV
jgi:hypothetical protein